MAANTRVTVVPEDRIVIVDNTVLRFDFNLVEGHENMHALQYNVTSGSGHIEFEDSSNKEITADAYEVQVAPYVTAWEAEKTRREEEAAAAEEEYNSLENVKARKLAELNAGLETARSDSTVSIMSSVGFEINANTTANENISGLITMMETTGTETTSFMAFDNTLQTVTLEDLKTMQLELVAWGQALYAYKWQVRAQIEAAETVEEVQAIVIDYSLAANYYATMLETIQTALQTTE